MSFWIVPGVALNYRAFPLCCVELTCVGRRGHSQTRHLSPAHCWGHSQTGVYLIFSSPRGRTHCGVVLPLSGLLAHCQCACTLVVLLQPGCIRKVHRGRRGRLNSLCHRWSPAGGALQHREGGRPLGGMDPQKHSIGHLPGASKFGDRNWFPLGFWLVDGRGRWCLPAPLFPAELNSVFWGSTPLPPGVLSPSCSLSRAVDL